MKTMQEKKLKNIDWCKEKKTEYSNLKIKQDICFKNKNDISYKFNNEYLIQKIKKIKKEKTDRIFETINFFMFFRKFEDLYQECDVCLWNEDKTYLQLLLSKTDYKIFLEYLDFVKTLNPFMEGCIYKLTIEQKRKIWKLTNKFKKIIKDRKYLSEFYEKY